MRGAVAIGVAALVFAGCGGTAHLDKVGLSGGGRELPELFLGGWDGKRLIAFDDTQIEPGVTPRTELVRVLKHLSSSQYAMAYIESAKLDAKTAEKHALFCGAPLCLAIFDRKGGSSLEEWGETLAVIELKAGGEGAIGPVWLAGKAIRAPGPKRWPVLCRTKDDHPRFVHPDGGALYPERPGLDGDGYALFGPATVPAEYKRVGFTAPSDTLCDEEQVRLRSEPEPERPEIKVDPNLLRIDSK